MARAPCLRGVWLAVLVGVCAGSLVRAQGFVPTSEEILRRYAWGGTGGTLGHLGAGGPADLSAQMPPVGNQGANYSCVAWATAYYLKSYQETVEHGWDPAASAHRFSPMCIYNQANSGHDGGISFYSALKLLTDKGCAALDVFPILSGDYMAWPNVAQCEAALPYRASSMASVFSSSTPDEEALAAVKALLDAGQPVAIGVSLYSDFDPEAPDYLYDGPGAGATYRGGHALTVVGYDDTKGGIGALKVVNSWGTSWGDHGYAWISYAYFGGYAAEGWMMTDRIGYQPRAMARVDITHPYRADLAVAVGVGNPSSPTWQQIAYSLQGGGGDDIHTSVDLTEALAHLPPSAANPWYVAVRDCSAGDAGTLDRFSIVLDGQEWSWAEAPLSIPDGGSTVYAVVDTTGANSPPTAPDVVISPASPLTADDLVAAATATDPDGDPLTYRYTWYRNGELQGDVTGDTVAARLTEKDDRWRCVVAANDGEAEGPTGEAEIVVGNTPPTAPEVAIAPAAPTKQDDLRAEASGAQDPDGYPVTYAYAWFRDGTLEAALTTETVPSADTAVGERWRCVVTPRDDTGEGEAGEAEVIVGSGNAAPTAPTVTIRPAAAYGDDDLEATAAGSTDAEGDPITYRYAWYCDGVLQGGLTTDRVPAAETTKGQVWRCVVTPNDGGQDGPSGEAQVTIRNTPPPRPELHLSPDAPCGGEALVTHATAVEDADGDAVRYSFRWLLDGVEKRQTVGTALTDTLPPGSTQRGQQWTCAVRVTDGEDTTSPVEAQTSIANGGPPAPQLVLAPSGPLTADNVHVTVTGCSDPDGDRLSYAYRWFRWNAVAGQWVLVQSTNTRNTSDVLPATLTATGERWKCSVRASDGLTVGDWAEAKFAIGNGTPTVPEVALSSTTPTSATGVRATIRHCTDPEGSRLSYAYRWFVWDSGRHAWVLSRELNSREASDTLPATLTRKGQRWKCSVRAGDGTAVGGWTERTFVVGNTPPPKPRLAVPAATTGRPVVATAAAVRDADGDTVRYGFRWMLGGVTKRLVATTANTDALPPAYVRRGQVWTCRAWTGDGEAQSGTAEVRVTIGNGAPPAPRVGVATLTARPGEAAIAVVAAVTDPDGDPVVYGYRWILNGVVRRIKVTSATRDVLPAGVTRAGETWTVLVRAGDGEAGSPSAEAQFRVGGVAAAAVAPSVFLTSVSAVPSGIGAQVVFALSAPASVRAEVLNIAGLPVKLITPGTDFQAGTQTVLWSGQSDAGLPVPNGRYLVRVSARGADGSESQALATVTVQR